MCCTICKKNDNFVKKDGFCILHTDKSKWVLDGRWKYAYTLAFYEELRDRVENSIDVIDLSYVIFPPFQEVQKEMTSSSKVYFDSYVSLKDSLFFKKGKELKFNKKVDFSFAKFYGNVSFENIEFEDVVFNNCSFESLKIDRCYARSLEIDKAGYNDVSIESSNIRNLNIHNTKLASLSIESTRVKEVNISHNNISSFNIIKSLYKKLNLNSLVSKKTIISKSNFDLLNIKESKIESLFIDEIKSSSLDISSTKLKSFKILSSKLESLEMYAVKVFSNSSIRTCKIRSTLLNRVSMYKQSHLLIDKLVGLDFIYYAQAQEDSLSITNSNISKKFELYNLNLQKLSLENTNIVDAIVKIKELSLVQLDIKGLEFSRLSENTHTIDNHSVYSMIDVLDKDTYYKSIEALKTLLPEGIDTRRKKINLDFDKYTKQIANNINYRKFKVFVLKNMRTRVASIF